MKDPLAIIDYGDVDDSGSTMSHSVTNPLNQYVLDVGNDHLVRLASNVNAARDVYQAIPSEYYRPHAVEKR